MKNKVRIINDPVEIKRLCIIDFEILVDLLRQDFESDNPCIEYELQQRMEEGHSYSIYRKGKKITIVIMAEYV